MGREFDFRVLELAGRLSVGRLMDVLTEAVAAGVIAQDPANPSRYAFAHDLVREIYTGAPLQPGAWSFTAPSGGS